MMTGGRCAEGESIGTPIRRAALLLCCCLLSAPAEATILRFTTTVGDIDVRMFDTATPASVANFMNYVNDGDYDGSFFHRMPMALDDHGQLGRFVLQGGGFKYTEAGGLTNVPTNAPVVNEPGISNLKYTVAYAKLGGDPNSATSGFFFNTQDNANNLDSQNGGFTVFARVVQGFDVLDMITSFNDYDLDGAGSTFNDVPLITPDEESLEDMLVYIEQVAELDLPAGDYNFDGVVNLTDYTIWRNGLGSEFDVRADGNGDGVVDQADYNVWRQSYGMSASAGLASPINIPEPSAWLLAAAATGLFWAARKKSGPRMSRTHAELA